MSSAHPSIAHASLGGLRLVLGGNVFGWTIDRDRSFEILDGFYEAGGRMIDTAEIYSAWVPGNKGGESEAIIGEWQESRGVRKDLLIGTKTGMGDKPDPLRRDHVDAALEASLQRLRTDYVDLYYAHQDDPVTPMEDVAATYDALYRAGSIREIGASNYEADRLAAIIDTAERIGAQPFTVLQPKYNLVARDSYEGALQDLCVARGVAVLPYYGLAGGFLSGKYRAASEWEGSVRAHTLRDAAAAGGFEILEVMDGVVKDTGATHAQVALAWLNARPGVAAPIASATSLTQLKELCEAASLVLTSEQIARLDGALFPAA